MTSSTSCCTETVCPVLRRRLEGGDNHDDDRDLVQDPLVARDEHLDRPVDHDRIEPGQAGDKGGEQENDEKATAMMPQMFPPQAKHQPTRALVGDGGDLGVTGRDGVHELRLDAVAPGRQSGYAYNPVTQTQENLTLSRSFEPK